MAKRSAPGYTLDAIAQQFDRLSHAELLEVQAMLAVLLAAKEQAENTDEAEAPEEYHGPKGGRGHIEVKLVPDNKRGKSYGPYRYLRYWQEGKLKTRYLGKADA